MISRISYIYNRLLETYRKNQDDVYSFGATICRSGSRFVLVFLASILLSKYEFGLLNIFFSIYFFARLFSENSLNLPFIKFASDGEYEPALVNSHIIILKILYVVIVSGIVLLFADFIIHYSGLERKSFINLLPLTLIGLTTYMFIGQVLNSQLKIKQLFLYEIMSGVMLVGLVAATAINDSISSEKLIFVFGCSMLLAAFVGLIAFRSYLEVKITFNRELFWKLASYSKYTVLSGISAVVIIKADVLMLGYFKDAQHVAIYGIALFVNEAVQVIFDSVQRICLPKASALSKEQRSGKIKELFLLSVKKIYVGLIPLVILIGIIAPFIITSLYKGTYDDSVILIYIFLLSAIVKPVGNVAGVILGATGNIKIDNRNCWLAAILNLVCNFILIPQFGVIGAAIASCISFVVLTLLHYLALQKVIKVLEI